MRRIGPLLVVIAAGIGAFAADIPVLNRPTAMLAPAIDGTGRRVAFGSATTPDGSVSNVADAYMAGVNGSNVRRYTNFAKEPAGANAIALSPDGALLAYTAQGPSDAGPREQVHVVDANTGADRAVVIDREGCILPLALCISCSFYCVNMPHLSPDGQKVIYSVRRNPPLRIVNADGTGAAPLPVYSGAIALAAQRVISAGGALVFTSSAPLGPMFAASATDVHTIKLDGSGLQNLTRFGSNSSVFAGNAVISADGNTIAFESNYNTISGQPNQIWIVRGDGNGLRQLSAWADGAGNPSISADGALVVYMQSGQIWAARTDGQSPSAPLTSFRFSVPQDPVINDDGTRVAFSLGPRAGERGAVYTIALAGGDPRPAYAPRSMNPDGVTSAAPGSLISVYGTNLALDAATSANRLPLPNTLAGVTLLVNGQAVPLLAVTPWQVNAQLPPETAAGAARFQFQFENGLTAAPVNVEVKSVAPELFSYPASAQPASVYVQAAAYHAGTAVAADVNNPAEAGEVLETYGGGLGATTPAVPAGTPSPADPPARTLAAVQALIGGRPATVVFSGLVAGFVGVYQVNAIVPAGLRPGLQAIGWRVGDSGVASSTISVR